MNLQGDFEGLNLSGIFQFLYNDQKTGFLRVTSEDKESRVYFNQGTIVYATSSLKESRLGFLMINDGILSKKQLKESLVLARDSKQSLGKILVEKGHVSIKILEKYNSRQVEEIIYNLLFWKKGRFEYKDAALNLKGMIVARLNPMKLILEASRRMDEMSDSIEKNRPGETKNAPHADRNSPGNGKAVITLFDDIFQVIYQQIYMEIGEQTLSLFMECRQELEPVHRVVLGAYHLNHPKESNIRAILDAVAMEEILEGHLFLIQAFSQYCIAILKGAENILGAYPVNKILREIENVLGYIQKYQARSSEQTTIISHIRAIIEEMTVR